MSDFENNVIDTAKKTAIISFILGSLIFLVFLFSKIENIAYVGLVFVFLAGIANTVTLLQLIFIWFSNIDKRKEIRNVILFVLINIPIAITLMKIGGDFYRDRFGF